VCWRTGSAVEATKTLPLPGVAGHRRPRTTESCQLRGASSSWNPGSGWTDRCSLQVSWCFTAFDDLAAATSIAGMSCGVAVETPDAV